MALLRHSLVPAAAEERTLRPPGRSLCRLVANSAPLGLPIYNSEPPSDWRCSSPFSSLQTAVLLPPGLFPPLAWRCLRRDCWCPVRRSPALHRVACRLVYDCRVPRRPPRETASPPAACTPQRTCDTRRRLSATQRGPLLIARTSPSVRKPLPSNTKGAATYEFVLPDVCRKVRMLHTQLSLRACRRCPPP